MTMSGHGGAASGGAAGQWDWMALSQKAADASARASTSSQRRNPPPRGSGHGKRPFLQSNSAPPASASEQRRQLREKQRERAAASSTHASSTDKSSASATERDGQEVERYSDLRITERSITASALRDEMKGRKFISLQQMDCVPKETFTDGTTDWVTIGVLTRKTMSKPAANGSTFMVWGLADLKGTELAVFLFGDAYATHWREQPGAIVAVLNATLLPATDKNRFAFKAAQPAEVVKLGKAVDFGICKGTTSTEARCKLAVNTARSHYCLHHITAKFNQAGRARQQLNNSVGSLRKSLFSGAGRPKNISAGVYSSASSANSGKASGWAPILTKKRKRNDSAGILGVPTVLSASGAVVQQTSRRPGVAFSGVIGGGGGSATADRARPGSLEQQLWQSGAPVKSARSGRGGASSASLDLGGQRATRGQKLISSMLAGKTASGKPLRRPKTKKVDMMRFMSTGSKS